MSNTVLTRAVEKFRQDLTDEQRQLFTASSLEKVNAEIQSIQDRHGSRKQLRSLSRMSKFLEAMTQIEQLAQIFLNVSEVVAFVWMASTRVQTLELLLDTYAEIGEVIPSLWQYEALFKEAPAVLEVLEKYFCDILEFHRNAMDVFGRPGWRACFDSIWKTFRTRFTPILESLKRHRALLMDERLNAVMLGIKNGRDQTLVTLTKSADQSSANFVKLEDKVAELYTKLSSQVYGLVQSSEKIDKALQRDLPCQEMNTMLNKLNPSGYMADQQTALQSCHKKSGDWIFQNPTFLDWLQSKALPDCVLFIHGMPGAGKTSLASRIVDHLPTHPKLQNSPVLYFLFKHIDNTKRSTGHMLRALLAQLVQQDATLAHILYEKCCLVPTAEAQSRDTLKSWAAELFKLQTGCTIILDGLDECNHHNDGQEARRLLDWLIADIIPECSKDGANIRLLCLGQRDGVVDAVLFHFPAICLDSSPLHLDDIRSFTAARASEIAQKFGLEPGEENHIVEKVASSSKSMFLYGKLVMDNLMAQGSAAELDEELNVKFPKGLHEAYERIAFRLFENPKRSQAQREAATRIVKWLTCAVRPLRWREIQSFFCINPHQGICNPRNRRVDDCKFICGSFVEINQLTSNMVYLDDADPVVSLVHDTARSYLIQSRRVIIPEANANMAIFASAYLASLPFRTEPVTKIEEHALSGYYGLLDYSVSSWQKHIEFSIAHRQDLPVSSLRSLQQAFLATLKQLDFQEVNEDPGDDLGPMKRFVDARSIKYTIQRLEFLSTAIRKVVEDIDLAALDDRARNTFLSFNGEQRYKCPKPRCLRFSHGFESRQSRDHHASQHYTQFTCPTEGCPRAKVGFFERSDLDQHTREAHIREKPADLFPTPSESNDPLYDACARGDIQTIKHLTAQKKSEPPIYTSHIVLAAENGQVELCQYFARNAAICSRKYEYRDLGPTIGALTEAIIKGNINMFRLLHEAATTEQRSKYVNSTKFGNDIGRAVWYATREFFDLLLSMNSTREQPFSYANIFLEATSIRSVPPENTTNIEYIFSLLSPENVSSILSGETLDEAIGSFNAPALIFLLRRVDDHISQMKSTNCDSPLYRVMEKGRWYYLPTLQALLANGLVNNMAVFDHKTGERPIYMACRQMSIQFLHSLLPYSITHLNDVNAKGQTPLHLAVLRGGASRVNALLKTGFIDISKRDFNGRTALETAKNSKIVALLQQAAGSAGIPSGLKTGEQSEGLGSPKPTGSPESTDDSEASVPHSAKNLGGDLVSLPP
ncbi:WD40 repeat-like protein, partial [Apiospora arundinis]